jgi:hypothetical protein
MVGGGCNTSRNLCTSGLFFNPVSLHWRNQNNYSFYLGAIMSATEAISLRGLSRDQYMQGVKLQDWARLASVQCDTGRKI